MTGDRIFIDDEEATVTVDRNADLIGFQYLSGIETVTVLGSASWSDTYVRVRYPSGFESIQRTELVRAKKEAARED